MSVQITTAFVEQYSANVMHLAQQQGSRIRSSVRVETVVGKNAFFEQIGATSARKRTSRHSDTPRMDTPHSRRRVSLIDYDWADLIDNEDKVRMLIDPTSPYALAAANAMGRAMDDEIINAADGTAFTGVAGGTSTSYSGLNVGKLRRAKQLLDVSEVEDEDRFCAINAKQLENLLAETEITSSDYNIVKALVHGEVNTFLGFDFLRTERLEVDANADDKVLYWQKKGLLLGVGQNPIARISERDDKNYAMQVFNSMAIGATRMEEVRVGYIECHPS